MNNRIKSTIAALKSECESILLSPIPANDHNQEYWTANYKGWILDPFIEKVKSAIEELSYNNYLIKFIENWIEELELFSESKLKRIATPRNFKAQQSFLRYFISQITEIKKEIDLVIERDNSSEELSHSNTILTRDETALLMLYLQESKSILQHGMITDSKLCSAFESLTGYKSEQLRKAISGQSRMHKNELSTNIMHYNKLKDTLYDIIKEIDKDISTFS